jgi:uncharacterized protein with FMN-binding domain
MRTSRAAAVLIAAAALTGAAMAGAALAGCSAAGFISVSDYIADVDDSLGSLAGLPDGTYSARASVAVPPQAFAILNWAEAEVTVAGGAIASARLTAPKRYPEMMAVPEDFEALASRVVAAQGTDVDGVSGATFTSAAFLKAIAKAVAR